MLNHQTLEKLSALRLEGMAQALEEQRRQTDISQLEFEDRLALLVERQLGRPTGSGIIHSITATAWAWDSAVRKLPHQESISVSKKLPS